MNGVPYQIRVREGKGPAGKLYEATLWIQRHEHDRMTGAPTKTWIWAPYGDPAYHERIDQAARIIREHYIHTLPYDYEWNAYLIVEDSTAETLTGKTRTKRSFKSFFSRRKEEKEE